jgi:ATP-dependent exoDNAse (exonuclease V) beta subunit
LAKYAGNEEFEDYFKYQEFWMEGDDPSERQRKFSQLCTELKFLYVAITRPKNRLFIYDE